MFISQETGQAEKMENNCDHNKLAALEARLSYEMQVTETPSASWLPELSPDKDYQIVICGAGMSGLSIAFGLKRRGVQSVLLIDKAEKGKEGPWVGCARMKTLRSPKTLSGPDFGLPSLTARAWYEAFYGTQAWDELDKLSRQDWMAYLDWYRKITKPHVENETELISINPQADYVTLTVKSGDQTKQLTCDRLIVATGLEGAGQPIVPEMIRPLPKDVWTHSAQTCCDNHLSGKDCIILGSATSSFDWAVQAIEKGAKTVTMIGRAHGFPYREVLSFTNFPGYLGHYAELPDEEKWNFTQHFFDMKPPPTQDQFNRAINAPNFTLKLGQKIKHICMEAGKIRVRTNEIDITADHLLIGTGYGMDLKDRPEFSKFADEIALWRDRYAPSANDDCTAISSHPYLGSGFELTAKDKSKSSALSRVHLFNAAAVPSLGPISNGVTGMKFGLPRIVDAVTRKLFEEHTDYFLSKMANFDEVHFDPGPFGAYDTRSNDDG